MRTPTMWWENGKKVAFWKERKDFNLFTVTMVASTVSASSLSPIVSAKKMHGYTTIRKTYQKHSKTSFCPWLIDKLSCFMFFPSENSLRGIVLLGPPPLHQAVPPGKARRQGDWKRCTRCLVHRYHSNGWYRRCSVHPPPVSRRFWKGYYCDLLCFVIQRVQYTGSKY